jgi:NAD-dependent SIR2 family protein deacetylase
LAIGGSDYADAYIEHSSGIKILAEVKSALLLTYPLLLEIQGAGEFQQHTKTILTSSQLKACNSALKAIGIAKMPALQCPGVVWFGESLPKETWERAQNAVKNCDVLFSVGTSAVVWPAAQLPIEAARSGATVIQVNPEKTDLDKVAHYNLHGQAGTVLPQLIEAITQ